MQILLKRQEFLCISGGSRRLVCLTIDYALVPMRDSFMNAIVKIVKKIQKNLNPLDNYPRVAYTGMTHYER